MSRPSKIDQILTKQILEEEYASLQSFRAIADKYGVSRETVRYYMKTYGLKYNEPANYQHNENFFAEDNEASFYVAGFAAADAYVYAHGKAAKVAEEQNVFAFNLSVKDLDHLKLIKNLIGAENPISFWTSKDSDRNPKWNDTKKCGLQITSLALCQSLKRFNVVQRKTHILDFPKWLEDHPLVHHFMRGYFDGDGSAWKIDGTNIPQIYFNIRGTESFLTTYRSILEKHNCVQIRNSEIRKSSGIGTLDYGGNGVVANIGNFLYRDATIFLKRKKDLVDQAIASNQQSVSKHEVVVQRREQEGLEAFRKAAHWRLNHVVPSTPTEFEILYQKEGKVRNVAKAMGVRISTASDALKSNGVELKDSKYDISKSELEALWNKHKQINLIAKELNWDPHTVTKYLKDFGIETPTEWRSWDHDHSFFSQDRESEKQFFWAGYLLGNSAIDPKTNSVRVTCKDRVEIEMFSGSGITNAPINESGGVNYISFSSAQILQDLKRFGIDKDKISSYRFPNWLMEHKYFHNFMVGRFNPDGRLSKPKKSLEFTGNVEYLMQLKEIINTKYEIFAMNEVRKREGKDTGRLTYTGKTAEIVCKQIT